MAPNCNCNVTNHYRLLNLSLTAGAGENGSEYAARSLLDSSRELRCAEKSPKSHVITHKRALRYLQKGPKTLFLPSGVPKRALYSPQKRPAEACWTRASSSRILVGEENKIKNNC